MPQPLPIYEEPNHRVYHGDMCAIVPWLGMVDHAWLDPPYSDTTHDGAYTKGKTIKVQRKLIDFQHVDLADVFIMLAILGTQTKRWVFGTMDYEHIAFLKRHSPADLEFIRKGVWTKPNGTPQYTGDRPGTGHEDLCIMHRAGKRKQWNAGGKIAVYVHNINSDGRYPSAKPESLVAELIRDFTDPGDLILDPFCGSGTTATVCKKLGRRSISIDRSRRAIDLTIARIKATEEAPIKVPEPKRKQEKIAF